MSAKAMDFTDISPDEIIWTLKDEASIEPFLDEHFPERKRVGRLGYLFKVKGGTVHITAAGNKVVFKELT